MNSKDLIAEMEFEATSTGKLLARVPAEKLNWQPHAKAMTLGQLAFHVASIPGRYLTFADESTTALETLVRHHKPASKEEILKSFAGSLVLAKLVLERATDEWGASNWELIKNDKSIFSIPRSLMCRLLVFNHWYHHRGELVTYLRTLGVLIPSVYGPSADEDPFAEA
jgi:uncharacterized damage-inducible protein DinB